MYEHYQPNEDGSKANFHTIEMSVVNTNDKNDPNYPYAQLSGGTKFPLCTINDEAAAMFEVGNDYDIVITPAEPAA